MRRKRRRLNLAGRSPRHRIYALLHPLSTIHVSFFVERTYGPFQQKRVLKELYVAYYGLHRALKGFKGPVVAFGDCLIRELRDMGTDMEPLFHTARKPIKLPHEAQWLH